MPYGDPGQQAKAAEAYKNRVADTNSGLGFEFYRKNGVPRIRGKSDKPKPARSTRPEPTYLQKAAARRAEQNSEDNRMNKGATTKHLKRISRDEEKRVNTNPGKGKSSTFATRVVNNEKSHAAYRAKRKSEGDFKGKYYGPDQFKGNTRMLARYRAMGSPKIDDEFIKNFKKWPKVKNKD